VLVADDNPANRELVRTLLLALGVETVEVPDGAAAIAIASAQPFDVILMDLRMPETDGYAATRKIRGMDGPNRTTPILAFSAADEDAGGALADAGFDGWVAKPIDPPVLIRALADWGAPAFSAPEARGRAANGR
jgi:CheY-like chemotaxis protein